MFVIRTASSGDVPAILRLLQEAGLRGEGVDKHPDSFWVLEEIGNPPRIAGTLGMEVYGRTGLLRSFVVERERWNPQVGVRFFLLALSAARERGIDELYLAAPGFLPFFEEIGFTEVEEGQLPEPIRESSHLRRAAGSGEARLMRCRLHRVFDAREEAPSLRRNPEGRGNSAGGCGQ